MSRIVIFILTTTSTLAALRRVDGQSSHVEDPVDGRSYMIKTTSEYSSIKSTDTPPHDEKDKWLIYVSAGPTVFIFIICVIAISVKNCSDIDPKEEGRSMLNPTAATVPTSPMSLLKPKPKIINEVYDKMLEQFKDDKNKNKTFVGRKCSQIQIQGVESGSPKSLARKHLIIGKLTGHASIEEVDENPIKALVARSTTTFIGGALLQEMGKNDTTTFIGGALLREMGKNESKDTEDSMEITTTVKEILRTSIEDLTEADRRTYCDELDEVLLPEDLEEAFKNFEFWEESDM